MTYRYGRLHTQRELWQYRSGNGSWQCSVDFTGLPNTDEARAHITSRGHTLFSEPPQ